MKDADYLLREQARSQRLLEFVKQELLHMVIPARMEFVQSMLEWLKPELDELARTPARSCHADEGRPQQTG